MYHRANTLLAQSGSTVTPQWAAGYRVIVTPVGARVAAAGSGVNTIIVDKGHSFQVGHKFLRNPGSADELSEAVTSVTAMSITISTSTYNVSIGDALVNLGPDTSAGPTPNYDGSTTPVYADPDGSTAYANSILLAGSQGNYDYYYKGDGRVWELILDSVNAPASVVTGFGGLARFNVVDFGAKGDNTGDDVGAFVAAELAASVDGGEVFVPEGTFLLGPTDTNTTDGYAVRLSANVRLVGAGREVSIIKGRSGVSATDLDIVSMMESDYNEVRDLSFDGNADSWKNAMRGWGVRYGVFHHIFAKDFVQHAVSVRKGTTRGSTECLIDNVIADGCNETGIIVWARATAPDLKNTHIQISNCISKNAATFYGFEIRYSDYCTMVNCQAFGNGKHGITLEEGAKHCSLTNCISYGNTQSGFYLEGNISAAEYNTIENCHGVGNTEHGVLVRSCNDNTFVGCTFKDNTLNGFADNSDSPVPTWNSVVDCIIENNAKAGLRIYGEDFLLRGGRVTNNGTAAAAEVRGLWLQSEALRARIVGTYFEGNVEDTTDADSADIFCGLADPADADHIIDTPTPGMSYVTRRASRFPGWHPAVHLPHQRPPNQANEITTDSDSFNEDMKVLKADAQFDRLFDVPLSNLFDGANDALGQTSVNIAVRIRAITDNLDVRWSDGTDFTGADDVTISTSENWRWIVKTVALASLSTSYVQSLRVQTAPTTGHILIDGVMISLS